MCELRRRLEGERGASLLEVSITTAILGLVMAVFFSVVVSLQSAVGTEEGRIRRTDEARLALAQLDREIRSGNVLYDPATENDPAGDIVPGMALRVYTQADAPNRDPGNQCSQWRITEGTLQTRRWATTDPEGSVTDWWTVAHDVANRSVTPAVDAFSLDGTPAYKDRMMNITLVVDRDDDAAPPERYQLSITGRNTQYGYPANVCEEVPPA